MKQPPDERSGKLTSTVLNHVTPTVVRRRVVEVPVAGKTNIGYAATDEDDDDAGPPSSVNVARALASLRGHELQRLEKILSDEEREEQEAARPPPSSAKVPSVPSPPSVPAVPTVRVGPTIALTLLAERLGVDAQEVVTALVTHGFFSVTVKTVLPRETARAATTLFGHQIVETDEVEAAPAKKTSAKKTNGKKTAAATRRTSRRA